MDVDIKSLIDENGRITRWPKKKNEKLEVLKYIRTKFETDKKYSEKEVNEVIQKWHIW
jgi:hypothetical protein